MTQPRREKPTSNGEQTAAKEKLQLRILDIVNRKGSADPMAIWRESAPDYLPWNEMLKEIRALDQDKRLRYEIIGTGRTIVHSLLTPVALDPDTNPAGKSKSKRTAKRAKKQRPAAPASEPGLERAPVTQSKLADLIEQGYSNPQLLEDHAYFLLDSGRLTNRHQPIYQGNALGAAFVGFLGLKRAWELWYAFEGSPADLLRQQMHLSPVLISQMADEHICLEGSLARVITKLKKGEYQE